MKTQVDYPGFLHVAGISIYITNIESLKYWVKFAAEGGWYDFVWERWPA